MLGSQSVWPLSIAIGSMVPVATTVCAPFTASRVCTTRTPASPSSGQPGTPNDFLYFSLATLTTVGYGDMTAATDVGRAVAVTEALLGQFYLVTVLAVIVTNVSRRRIRD